MRNLSRSKKAQFFVMSAFAIVTVLYFVGKWSESYTIIDTSAVVLNDQTFIFDNIKEKAEETVKQSDNCEELEFNLQEYKNFVEKYTLEKNLRLYFKYTILQPCNNNLLATSFDIALASSLVRMESKFTANSQ